MLPVDVDGGVANHWHTDVTFVLTRPGRRPSRARSSPHGGETLIANTGAAYRDLPEPLRRLADGLRAVHTNAYDYATLRSSRTTRRPSDARSSSRSPSRPSTRRARPPRHGRARALPRRLRPALRRSDDHGEP
ncbi:TauD/TfdA dioxygenase family protein [Janibacter melonis]|uniref:TauD/TfdA dioxygenase family protein n=1 Tax=Janibacter melonis TaxID=262209 RepID=UPI0027DA1A2E|nr:TauD/TfdA family dioxygenase [Janibacter melonis]